MPDDKLQVEVTPEPIVDLAEGSVVVDLEAKPQPTPSKEDELVKKLESTISAKYDRVLKNLENQLAGARRIIERQEKERTQQPKPQPEPTVEQQKVYQTELDRLKDTDPWKAVDMLAEEKAKEMLKKQETERQLNELNQKREVTFNKSLEIVRSEYPTLFTDTDDGLTELDILVKDTYRQIQNENQELLSDPYGPTTIKEEMERRLLQSGVDLPLRRMRELYLTQGKSQPRRVGVEAGSLPPGRATASDGKYTLTPDEKTMCETYGIPLEEYARTARALNVEGQVTT